MQTIGQTFITFSTFLKSLFLNFLPRKRTAEWDAWMSISVPTSPRDRIFMHLVPSVLWQVWQEPPRPLGKSLVRLPSHLPPPLVGMWHFAVIKASKQVNLLLNSKNIPHISISLKKFQQCPGDSCIPSLERTFGFYLYHKQIICSYFSFRLSLLNAQRKKEKNRNW